jgi:hypothetical protein
MKDTENDTDAHDPKRETFRFSIRTTVAVIGAAVLGVAAGTLTYLASRSIPQAVLTEGAATGGSARFLHQILGSDRPDQGDRRDDVEEERRHQSTPPA